MTVTVVTASAVLAWLQDAPGASMVEAALPGAAISSVAFADVLAAIAARGGTVPTASADLQAYGLVVHPFTADHAAWCAAAGSGDVPLGDRASAALGAVLGATVLTADPAWTDLPAGVTVQSIT